METLLLELQPFLTLLGLVVAMVGTIIAISVLLTTKRILGLCERRNRFLAEEQQRLEARRTEYALLENRLEQEREERLAAQRKVELLEDRLKEAAKSTRRKASSATDGGTR